MSRIAAMEARATNEGTIRRMQLIALLFAQLQECSGGKSDMSKSSMTGPPGRKRANAHCRPDGPSVMHSRVAGRERAGFKMAAMLGRMFSVAGAHTFTPVPVGVKMQMSS